MNGYYKAELIRGPAREGRPWKSVEDVELATLCWVHWHNHQRLHGYLGDVPPAEFEETFYAALRTDQPLVGIPEPESPSDPGRVNTPPAALFDPGLLYASQTWWLDLDKNTGNAGSDELADDTLEVGNSLLFAVSVDHSSNYKNPQSRVIHSAARRR